MLKAIIEFVLGIAILIVLAMLMLEWVVGCGESYEDAQGKTHIQDCIFIK